MASKMMRIIAGAAAIFGVAVNLQGCAGPTYKIKEKKVYSNSKYLADFQDSMSKLECEKACSSWTKGSCDELCKKEKSCGLGDEIDARHFTRETSCSTECVGFNMHTDEHCTLFAKNVDLIADSGGRGTFYLLSGKKIGQELDTPKKEEKKAEEKEEKKEEGSYGSKGNNNNNNDDSNYGSSSNNNNNYASNSNNNNNYASSNNNNNYASNSNNNNNYASNSNNNNNYASDSNNNNNE